LRNAPVLELAAVFGILLRYHTRELSPVPAASLAKRMPENCQRAEAGKKLR